MSFCLHISSRLHSTRTISGWRNWYPYSGGSKRIPLTEKQKLERPTNLSCASRTGGGYPEIVLRMTVCEDRGPITSSTVFHSLKFKGMQDVHLCLYICMYHTVIRSTISGYPHPVHKAQLKFIGRSSFCFSVKGIRFEPPEYGLSWWKVNLRRCEDRKT